MHFQPGAIAARWWFVDLRYTVDGLPVAVVPRELA